MMASMSRRGFLGTVIGTAGATLGAAAAHAQPHPRSATDLIPLGKTGVNVSFLGIGTGVHGWMRSSNGTRMPREAFHRLIRHAYDSGIRLFDCADLYGTHPLLREALKGIPRHHYAIQSKLWWQADGLPDQVKDGTAAIERFCKELGTDYIDSLLVHCTSAPSWTSDLRPLMDDIGRAKDRGILRSHGTSCHSLPALQTSLATPWVDVQLARINHTGVIMDGAPQQIADVLKQMRRSGKGVLGMKIFGEGRFQSVDERLASLRFVIGQQCVDAMVIGFETPAQIDETIAQVNQILTA